MEQVYFEQGGVKNVLDELKRQKEEIFESYNSHI